MLEKPSMPILRFDHLLAGSAIALTLALTAYADSAFARTTEAEVSNAVPAPASAEVPPSAVGEISPAPTDGDVTNSVPTDQTFRATALSVADAAVGEQLRDLLASGKLDRALGGRNERNAIEAFYQNRSFAPLWITDAAMNDRAKAAAAYLVGVAAHGLEPADYPLPEFKSGLEPGALAEAELRFTDAVLSFARHAQIGRVHFSRIASDIDYKLERPEAGDVLAKIASAGSAADALESFHPPHPGYRALKAKLAEARARKNEEIKVVRIPDGPLLRYRKDNTGREILMQDPRVPLLRERLGMAGKPNDTSYDTELADAVLDFQKKNGLNADGVVGPATLIALNGGPRREREVDIIIANMERWRWIPRDLG
jgi:L,D-transpeptidase YcbB